MEAHDAAATAAAVAGPMMFSDVVAMAKAAAAAPFSGWVVLILIATFLTWFAHSICRRASLVFVLPLIAVLLLAFESVFLDRSPSGSLILAIALGGAGAGSYKRLSAA